MELILHMRTQHLSMGNESLLEIEGTRVAQKSVARAQDQNVLYVGAELHIKGGSHVESQLMLRGCWVPAEHALSWCVYNSLGFPVTSPAYHLCIQS